MKDLTSSAGEDVVLAMNTFIKRLLAVSDPGQMKVCDCIMLYYFYSPFWILYIHLNPCFDVVPMPLVINF